MPPMSKPILLALAFTLMAVLACSAPLASAPTPTPTHTPTFTPTQTPTPSPTPTNTPTPSPSDLVAAGQAALFNGDWEQAIARFDRVIAESQDPLLIGEARYSRGVALYRAGDLIDAEQVLWNFISDYGGAGHPRLAQARLLRGDLEMLLGDANVAAEDYRAYLDLRPGMIDSYAGELLGDALRARGRPAEAQQAYQAALAAGRAGNQLPVMVKLGRAMMQAEAYDQAIAQFDLVASLTEDHATKASMNLLAAEAYERLGDLDSMYARLLNSVANYPTAQDSYVGLVRLVNDGVVVDEFQRGLVDYHAAAYEPAIAAFDRIIVASPTAQAYYYRGLSYRALGSAELALTDFDFVVETYPDDPLWSEALFDKALTEWAYLDRYTAAVASYLRIADTLPEFASAPQAMMLAGRTAERVGDLPGASQIWLDLVNRYPQSELAPEAAFQAGIALYRQGDYPAAVAAFGQADAAAPGVRQHSAAQLWIGKSHAALGQTAEAQAAWELAAGIDPTGYYSERAAELLAGGQPFTPPGGVDLNPDLAAERQAAEDWLRATFGVADSAPLNALTPELAADPRLVRGEELWELGRWEQARTEFQALRLALSADAAGTYRLMHRLLELGLYREAIFAARQILTLAGMDDAGTMQAPVYFNRIRFGLYYGDLILPEANCYGFDELFLLSVVRQESLFEGFAISSASARGLMQVIPPTGESIAAQLGWPPNYEQADLYRPIVSVRFGTYYLSQQSQRFEGDLYAALAAYNAGPGNSIIWKELAPTDPDLFLEVIRLDQPQIYIQVIYEVHQIYKSLYGTN